MPSDLALKLANSLKSPPVVDVYTDSNIQGPESWFKPRNGLHTNFIPFTSIAANSDRENDSWIGVGDSRIQHEHTLGTQLLRWVLEHTVEEIANVLDRVPGGLGADPDTGKSFDFGGWQRLSMAHWSSHLFDVTSSVNITAASIWSMAGYIEGERARKIGIGCQMTMFKGSCPDMFICNLGTSCGKTSYSISATLSKLIGGEFESLKDSYRRRMMDVPTPGQPVPNIARMIIIAAAGPTFRHFVTTAQRIIPRVQSMDLTAVIQIWDKVGKNWNTTIAASAPLNVITIWVVPVERIMTVLRHDPSVTIPVLIIDEFTEKTPKQRSVTDQSFVMKHMILQATPKALQDTTCGNTSLLKEEFGGYLHGPCDLKHLVRRREWKDAQRTASNIVKLDLMTLTPFRLLVREELRHLIPVGIQVTFLHSRRVTMAAHLTNSDTDVVPANFANIILSSVGAFYPDDKSRELLKSTLDNGIVTPSHLVDVLETCTSKCPNKDRAIIKRLQTRLTEFETECPICKDDKMTNPNMFGCCGYCVCDDCFQICDNRCPFCRTKVRTVIPIEDVIDDGERDTMEERRRELLRRTEDDKYPAMSGQDIVLSPQNLRSNNILANITHAIHHLSYHGHRRLLIVLERPYYGTDLSLQLDLHRLSSVTGVVITRIDTMLSGKADVFSNVKREFDSPNPCPMALLCFGVMDTFMVGTDLASADGIVIAGSIQDSIMTQAISRTLRPNAQRDNSRPLPQINIVTR